MLLLEPRMICLGINVEEAGRQAGRQGGREAGRQRHGLTFYLATMTISLVLPPASSDGRTL